MLLSSLKNKKQKTKTKRHLLNITIFVVIVNHTRVGFSTIQIKIMLLLIPVMSNLS